ncbi:MAG: DUF4238 domain-containing protein [Comamonas sp.]|nr:DUF4238 domain-containing protein [Comamonas sp.]
MNPTENKVAGDVLRVKNHYVPEMYLKNWAQRGQVATYALLVPNTSVPHWKKRSLRGIGYHRHLYTYLGRDGESDLFECWLGEKFESPAVIPIQKMLDDQRLSREDWYHLTRFLAAQDVRTPARLHEFIQRNEQTLQQELDKTVQASIAKLERLARSNRPFPKVEVRQSVTESPFKVSIQRNPAGDGYCKAEAVSGRKLWVHMSEHMLTDTLQHLHKHRWTIFEAPAGIPWLTSDKPVVRLNYYEPGNYDFKGGWGNQGSEILFPLSPRHLMYTRIGHPLAKRKELVSEELAVLINRFIAEHAHSYIFASAPSDIEGIRPRHVSLEAFLNEKHAWEAWHQQQSQAEAELIAPSDYVAKAASTNCTIFPTVAP